MIYKKPSSPVYHRIPRSKVGTAAREAEYASYGIKSELLERDAVKRNKAGKSNGAAYTLYHYNPVSAAMNKKEADKNMEMVRQGKARYGGMPYTAIERNVAKKNAQKKGSSAKAKQTTEKKKQAKAQTPASPKAQYAQALYAVTKKMREAEKKKLYQQATASRRKKR